MTLDPELREMAEKAGIVGLGVPLDRLGEFAALVADFIEAEVAGCTCSHEHTVAMIATRWRGGKEQHSE
jgi:hypothetical protein